MSVAVTAVVYGLVVAAITRGLGPPEAVPAGGVWTAGALALVAAAGGMLTRGSAWRHWWSSTVDDRIRLGIRGGGIGLAVLIAGGALALTVGLLAHFGSAVGVAAIAAPTWSDGLGMAMLGLAFLPNAVIAGAGYVTGVGFEIGPGTYSPLATATVDLPAVPLLAAAPDQSGRSVVGLAFLAVPVIAGYLIARTVSRRLEYRLDRLVAAAAAGLVTGVLLGVVAAIARGGVGDGRWSVMGAPPLMVGAMAAAEVGIVAVAAAAIIGGKGVPWRPVATTAAEPAVDRDVDPGPPLTEENFGIDDDALDLNTAKDEEAGLGVNEGGPIDDTDGNRMVDDRIDDEQVDDQRVDQAADGDTGRETRATSAVSAGEPAGGHTGPIGDVTRATGGLIPEQRRSPEGPPPSDALPDSAPHDRSRNEVRADGRSADSVGDVIGEADSEPGNRFVADDRDSAGHAAH